MENPIQQILRADADARTAIEDAHRRARTQLQAARNRAHLLVEHNEKRTQRAIRHYRASREAEIGEQIAQIQRDSAQATQDFVDAIEQRTKQIVDMACREVWPG